MIKVKTYINEGPGMLWRYQPGDRLDPLQVDQAILDLVWIVGNRMASDGIGQEWPSGTRSLSTGDVLIVGEAAYAIASVGFEPINTNALQASLSPSAKEHRGLAEHRLAQR